MHNYDEELTVHELLKTIDVPMIELEPYLLEVRKQKYSCSIKGLFQWINTISKNKSVDVLKKNDISWILLMRIVADSNYHELLDQGVLEFLEKFVSMEVEKIVG